MPEREHAWPIYDIFETAGGERIFIGVVTEGHWQSFCKEFGLTEFPKIPRCAPPPDRIMARSRIIPRATAVIKGWNVADLSAKLDELNICFSPINRPEDLFDDPHVLRPGGLVNNINANGETFRVPRPPRCNGTGPTSAKASKSRRSAPTPKPSAPSWKTRGFLRPGKTAARLA